MMRGIERRTIFLDDRDRHDFLERLCELLPEEGLRCFGWALMPSHVHLLVRTGPVPLSHVMRRLNTGYATRFNKRHERSGYLFQNRFKSRLAVDDADLMNLVRYVNGNPLKDGLVHSVAELAGYEWSGFGALEGSRGAFPFESVDPVLRMFGPTPDAARASLRTWMGEPLAKTKDPADAAHAPLEAPAQLLGEPSAPSRTFEEVLERVCTHYDLLALELIGADKRRIVVRARAALCFLASSEIGMSAAELSRRIGVDRSAIGRCIRRGRSIVREEGLFPQGEWPG